MEFRILGPLQVEAGGVLLAVGRRQPRALLTLLLLEANRVVARDRLAELLWGESPPERAANTLQVYVSQLRASLGRDLIATQSPGYVIHVDEDQLDLERFQLIVSKTRHEDPEQAAAGLREALSLWRGPALVDLPDTPLANAERRRLDELHLSALEARIDADLALGEHTTLVPELETLVREHPFRERIRAQLMLALYRSGRQADALEVFAQGRRLLADELGLEPGYALKLLQKAILEHDPQLAAPPPRTRAGVEVTARPRGSRRRRLVVMLAAGVLVLAAGITATALELTGTRSASVTGNAVAAIGAAGGSIRSYTDVGATPSNIAVGDGSVWVLNSDDRTISRIDPRTRQVAKTFALGTTPTDLAAAGGALWVGNGAVSSAGSQYTRSVSRIDPRTTSVSATARLPGQPSWRLGVDAGLSGLSASSGSVWAVDPDGTISRLDAATGQRLATLPVNAATSIAADRTGVWFLTTLASGEPAVAHISARTGRTTQTIPIAASSIRGLALGNGSLWAADPIDGTVWRIEQGPHPVARTIQVGFGVSCVAVGDGAVWVANFLRGTVSRIDPHTNSVATTIAIAGTPLGVAVGDGSAWISVAGATVTGNLSSTNCSPVQSGGRKPDLLIASDLPLQGPSTPTLRLLPAAIEAELALHHFTAGRYHVGYQSCDDSTAQEGSFDFFRCAANARAYAADQKIVAVIGPYNSGCAQAEIPILNRAPGGSLPLLSPSSTLPSLTRTSLMNSPGEPALYYPTGTRNYFRVSAADDLEGTADAELAQRLHLHRVYALSDGTRYGRASIARFTTTAKKLHLTVAGSADWNPTSRDQARLAAAVAKTGAQGVFLAGFPFESGALIKSLRSRLGAKLILIGSDGYLPISDLLKAAGAAGIGMYVSDAITMNTSLTPAGRRVLHELETSERTSPVSGAYVPEAVQLASLVLDAIAHSTGTRDSILDAIRRAHVAKGILGDFRFDLNGDKTPATFTVVRVTGRTRDPGLSPDFQGSTIVRTIVVQPNLTNP